MGAKLKSKTHLLNTFFDFLSRFLRFWLQSLKKVLIWPKKNFFWKKIKKGVNAEFHADFKSVEKLVKNAPKKVINKTSLTNMSKSEKSAFFRHVFANNFYLVNFFKTFSTDSKSAWNSAFFDTFFDFFKQKFFKGHICTFFKLWLQMRRKRLKKTENLFLWMHLRILLCNYQRVSITKLLKSLYPNAQCTHLWRDLFKFWIFTLMLSIRVRSWCVY